MTVVDYGPDVAALRRRLEAAEAEVSRLTRERDEARALLDHCPTCDGGGVMDVTVGWKEPSGEEVVSAEVCGECEGTGVGSWGQAIREVARLRAVVEAFDSIAWMAEQYAEAGGSSGPEMRSYAEAMEARAALDAEVPRG